MTSPEYPKRLIEVDLPIKEISAHARREKSIRHGHISTLHIWWARRPLAACRAVLCASLWPDPADENCPQEFREHAANTLITFAENVRTNKNLAELCQKGWARWKRTSSETLNANNPGHWGEIRYALLDFIADFSNWDASTIPEFLETSRSLTQHAHEALGGITGTKPLVVDPFAGGGSIPLEALRIGADAFASDLNPVAVLLNKVVLEYIPKYGQRLADDVRKWGNWIKEQAEKELAEFYPNDSDGATPIAYLWARTIKCEGPACGVEVPLIRSLWLANRKNKSIALQLKPKPNNKHIDFVIIEKKSGKWFEKNDKKQEIKNPDFSGTVKRGAVTCPCCGYTTQIASIRKQLKAQRGGANNARLITVVCVQNGQNGRIYRLPRNYDLKAIDKSNKELDIRKSSYSGPYDLVPNEQTPKGGGSGAGRAFSQRNYGMNRFEDLFTKRQLLAITSLIKILKELKNKIDDDLNYSNGVLTCLAIAISKLSDLNNSLCTWRASSECVDHLFSRQAIPITWDFSEAVPICNSTGSWQSMFNRSADGLESAYITGEFNSTIVKSSAYTHPLPDDSSNAFITDPPYYDAVPYADLSDFFYVWLKRAIGEIENDLFNNEVTPKEDECILDEVKGKDKNYFEKNMGIAMAEGRRILNTNGIGLVVFAHKTTAGWEAQLQSMINSGWIFTGSWPIDTEMGARLRAMESAALASSIHLVCRPRENPDGSLKEKIGDWRDVLQKLPKRIHEWMPRLQQEGVVGADAIFSCLGPALEIFSRYSRVEKASGDVVTLREYLEHVWAAVAKEALTMIFKDVDSTGYEEDARLTAMWLWTISTGGNGNGKKEGESEKSTGYILEYDAARKIAQGLGAHLEKLKHLVEIKGDKARLLPVAERTRHLFGKENPLSQKKQKKRTDQIALFETLNEIDQDHNWNIEGIPKTGETTLDKVHQSMLLFAIGRGEALKRFLVEEGTGKDTRFWQLAQALSALYPSQTDEKRWVDGVLARKKSLGF